MSTATSSRLVQLPKLGRASRSWARVWQAPTFLAGLVVFAAVAATAPLRQDPALVEFEEDIVALRQGLAAKSPAPDILIAQAENLLARLPKFTRRSSEVRFLAGSAYVRLAEKSTGKQAVEACEKAAVHFDDAFTRGVASEDNAVLCYRYGWALYRLASTDRQLARAIELLSPSIENGADSPGTAYGVLVEAHLRRTPPDMAKALAASQKQLELTDDRNVAAMASARLTHAALLLRKERRLDAIKELERIGPTTPKDLRVKARLLQAEACAAEGLWNKTIPLWQDLLAQPDAVPGGKAAILYHLGLGYRNADPAAPEEAAKHWEEALALGGNEGRAAGLQLGELYLHGAVADAALGLEKWAAALAGLRTPTEYDGKLLPLDNLRAWFETAFRGFVDAPDFRRAEQLAQLYVKIALPGRANALLGEALYGAALETRDRLKTMPDMLAAKKRDELARQFHRAAVAFEEASTQIAEPLDILWQAVLCYREAGDHAHTIKAIERFVLLEKEEVHLAEAWLTLAEARVASAEKDKALEAYYKCIEYPSTPFAYRARYELALDEIEKKNYAQAIAILNQNLASSATADPLAQEKSIYKLAGVLILLKDYDTAVIRLKEATRQFPSNPLALPARDQLAQCYKTLADQDKVRLEAASSLENQAYYSRKRNDNLERQYVTCQELSEELETKAAKTPLDATEQALLRRALFGAVDARHDSGQFAESLRLARGIQGRYRRKLESLVACQRIYKCVGVTTDPAQWKTVQMAALEAVALAKEDLATIPAESDVFEGPGVWSHKEWTARLEEIQERLRTPPTATPAAGPVIR